MFASVDIVGIVVVLVVVSGRGVSVIAASYVSGFFAFGWVLLVLPSQLLPFKLYYPRAAACKLGHIVSDGKSLFLNLLNPTRKNHWIRLFWCGMTACQIFYTKCGYRLKTQRREQKIAFYRSETIKNHFSAPKNMRYSSCKRFKFPFLVKTMCPIVYHLPASTNETHFWLHRSLRHQCIKANPILNRINSRCGCVRPADRKATSENFYSM